MVIWKRRRKAKTVSAKRPRDSQRSRVYEADESLNHLSQLDLTTVPAIEAYVRKVWATKSICKRWPAITVFGPPKVGDGRGRRRASGGSDWIKMPKWSRREGIVLHELAHTISFRVYGRTNIAGHGWEFCAIYLWLVHDMMGPNAALTLRAAFDRHGVRYRAPRAKRQLSPEHRARLTAQLAVARAAKKLNKIMSTGASTAY